MKSFREFTEATWPDYDEKKVKGGTLRSTTIPKEKMAEYTKDVVKKAQEAGKLFRQARARKWNGSKISDMAHNTARGVKYEETIQEVHPPGPGFESWVKHRKADFKKRYGDRWKNVLYATAWKLKNKHPGGIKSHGE